MSLCFIVQHICGDAMRREERRDDTQIEDAVNACQNLSETTLQYQPSRTENIGFSSPNSTSIVHDSKDL